jgi:hypothetical protein
MELSAEKRQELLIGDIERKTRNLPCFGFADATGAPGWAQRRILEIREALVENRAIPAPSPEYLAGCEQRSAVAAAAMRTVTRLFPTTRPAAAPSSADAVLRSIANRQAAELHNDQKVLARARRDAEEKRNAEELAEGVAAFNAATFPWARN